MYDQNQPVDLITASEQLVKEVRCKKSDYEYLSNLATSVPTTANAKHYAPLSRKIFTS